MSYSAEVESAVITWLTKHRATRDPEVLSKVVARAREIHTAQGGYFSPSHLERAYLELSNENEITGFSGNMQEQLEAESSPIPKDALAFIESPHTSVRDIRRRYTSDPAFRKHYDLWEKSKKPQQHQAPATVTLTVQEYRSIPAAVIAARYQREPGFRAAVDSLINRGLIALLLLLPLVRHVC